MRRAVRMSLTLSWSSRNVASLARTSSAAAAMPRRGASMTVTGNVSRTGLHGGREARRVEHDRLRPREPDAGAEEDSQSARRTATERRFDEVAVDGPVAGEQVEQAVLRVDAEVRADGAVAGVEVDERAHGPPRARPPRVGTGAARGIRRRG